MKGLMRKQFTFGDDLFVDKTPEHPTLDGVLRIVDWRAIDKILAKAYPSYMGRPSYPPRQLFKSLLLAQWFQLSDRELEFHIQDRLSFQKFLGFGLQDATPDATTICRFRQRLIDARLYNRLFDAIQRQMEKRGMIVKRGTLVDATFIQAHNKPPAKGNPSAANDPDAAWAVKNGHAKYGYKLHVAVDQESELVRGYATTPGNTNDTSQFDKVFRYDSKAVFADKAYSSYKRKRKLRELGIFCGILDKGQVNRPLNDNQIERNKKLSRVRAAVERCFARLKWHMGFYRGRYKGLLKMSAHISTLMIAYNLQRAVKLSVV